MAKPASLQDSSEFAQGGKHLIVVKMFDAVGAPNRIERTVFNNAAHIGDRSNEVGGGARIDVDAHFRPNGWVESLVHGSDGRT